MTDLIVVVLWRPNHLQDRCLLLQIVNALPVPPSLYRPKLPHYDIHIDRHHYGHDYCIYLWHYISMSSNLCFLGQILAQTTRYQVSYSAGVLDEFQPYQHHD